VDALRDSLAVYANDRPRERDDERPAGVGAVHLRRASKGGRRARQPWVRGTGIPIPLTSKLLPIPHFVRMKFVIGEPIPPPDSDIDSNAPAVRRMRREVEGALHELFEHELAARVGMRIE